MNNLLNEVFDKYGADIPLDRPAFRAADEPLFRRIMKSYKVWFRFTAAYRAFLRSTEAPEAPAETTLEEVIDAVDIPDEELVDDNTSD